MFISFHFCFQSEMCIASGPGKDMFESTMIIGTKQYQKAKDLYAQANITGLLLSGPVDFRHQFADMAHQQFSLPSGEKVGGVFIWLTWLPG